LERQKSITLSAKKFRHNKIVIDLPLIKINNEGGSTSGNIAIYMLSNKNSTGGNFWSNGYPYGEWQSIYSSALDQYQVKWKFEPDEKTQTTLNPGESWSCNCRN